MISPKAYRNKAMDRGNIWVNSHWSAETSQIISQLTRQVINISLIGQTDGRTDEQIKWATE